MQEEIKKYPSLTVCEDSVEDVLVCTQEGGQHPKINGVILGTCVSYSTAQYLSVILFAGSGEVICSNAVIITTGTFLRGIINIGTATTIMLLSFYYAYLCIEKVWKHIKLGEKVMNLLLD